MDFLAAGSKVTICSRKQENVESAIKELGEHSSLSGLTAHVGRAEEIEQLVDAAEAQFGTVNVLINNAGTNPYFGPIIDSELEAWDKTMDINVRGPYLLSKACAQENDTGRRRRNCQRRVHRGTEFVSNARDLFSLQSGADHVDQSHGQGTRRTRRSCELHLPRPDQDAIERSDLVRSESGSYNDPNEGARDGSGSPKS